MQKGLAPILVVILIALAVGGYMFIQKQTKPVVLPQPVIQPSSSPVASPVATTSAEPAYWKTVCKNFINDPKIKYKECGMGSEYNSADDKKMCEEIGGQYVSCASPCRHDPPGTMCVQMCVPLCTFQ